MLQARLVGKANIRTAAQGDDVGLVQDHVLADAACVHVKDDE